MTRPLFFAALLALGAALAGCNCGGRVGTATPRATVRPRSIDFGDRVVGTRSEAELRLGNEGTATLFILGARIEGDARSAFSIETPPSSLAAGAEAPLAVSYSARDEGQDTATLILETDDNVLPEVAVSLVGRAVPGCAAGLAQCGGACVDTEQDSAHCGLCDRACGSGQRCEQGTCVCVPKSCTEQGAQCGQVQNGCGVILECGGCVGPDTCGGGGLPNRCGHASDAGEADGGTPDAGTPDAGPGTCLDGGAGPTTWRSSTYIAVPHVLWTGSQYAAVWYERPGGSGTAPMEVWFGFLSRTGALVPGSAVSVTDSDGWSSVHPKFDFSGSQFGVVYSDDRAQPRKVYFSRVSGAGAPIAGSELLLHASSQQQNHAQIAWSPLANEWGVAWVEGSSPGDVYFARVSAAGALVPGSVLVAAQASPTTLYTTGEGLRWSGSVWGLAVGSSTLNIQEISPAGALGALIPIAPGSVVGASRASLASNGTHWAVTWSDYRSGKYQARFALATVGGSYVAGSDLALGTPGIYSGDGSIIWNGTHFVATWGEDPVGNSDVWVAKLGPSGNLVSRAAAAASAQYDWWSSVASDGCGSLVTYQWDSSSGSNEGRSVLVP